MFKKELLIPALVGLGIYAQNSEVNLCNNTTMILLLFAVLENGFGEHREEKHHKRECERDRDCDSCSYRRNCC